MPIELFPGFFVELDPKDETTRLKLASDWALLATEIEQVTVELWQAYTESDTTLSTSVWATFVEPSIRYKSAGNFTLTCSFTWQASDDTLMVTFCIEQGKLNGCDFDG